MGVSSRPGGRTVGYVAGAVVAAVAWALLVRLAIHLGRHARVSGEALDWTWTVLVTLVADACLLLVLLLAARGWARRAGRAAADAARRGRPTHRR